MKHKSILLSALTGILLLFLIYLGLTSPSAGQLFSPRGDTMPFRTQGTTLQHRTGDTWQDFEMIGVNMGSGYPGYFPNEGGIDRDTFLRWFEEIADMHANTIRVYHLQTPDFYTALRQYNKTHEHKLYLLQTIDFPESLMFSEENVLAPETLDDLLTASEHTVDALHGDLITINSPQDRLDCYLSDVSDYVLGYLMGIEWDEVFVDFVCRMNSDIKPYAGNFLTCGEESNAFENFLTRWGDHLLSYEDARYGDRRLISFCNWPDTDPILNKLDLYTQNGGVFKVEPNTEVLVDIEHIRCTDEPQAGIFASYNVYPYYPLFLQMGNYTKYVDAQGKNAPYEGYLRSLTKHHAYPVVISEYGIPSSRSVAHEDIWRHFTHGGLNERQQGEAAATLFRDIREAGCAGSLLFTWQDEWYKRTWNEQTISDPDGRAFWSNVQSSEQNFGLLSFDPGEEGSCIYPDGELSDWREEDLVWTQDGKSLSMRTDERYVHFLIQGFDPRHGVTLALDTLPGSGVTEQKSRSFGRGVDFLVRFDRQGARLLVHDNYSLLLYSMADKMSSGLSQMYLEEMEVLYGAKGLTFHPSNRFHVVQRASGSIFSTLHHALHVDPVGELHPGNGNPLSPDFDSNADYCVQGDSIELRLPWQLLNFRDPSRGTIVDDLYKNDFAIRDVQIDTLYAALYTPSQKHVDDFAVCPLRHWKHPCFHERLKASYYILREEFQGVNPS